MAHIIIRLKKGSNWNFEWRDSLFTEFIIAYCFLNLNKHAHRNSNKECGIFVCFSISLSSSESSVMIIPGIRLFSCVDSNFSIQTIKISQKTATRTFCVGIAHYPWERNKNFVQQSWRVCLSLQLCWRFFYSFLTGSTQSIRENEAPVPLVSLDCALNKSDNQITNQSIKKIKW